MKICVPNFQFSNFGTNLESEMEISNSHKNSSPFLVFQAIITGIIFSVFFKTVLAAGEGKVTMQLASVLLERIVILYELEPFAGRVRHIMAEQLLGMFRLHPQLLFDQQRELLEYLGNLRTLTTGGEHCYMHLVSLSQSWIM